MFSPSHIIIFLISAHIVLYRQRNSGHHFGTKAVKIIVVISVITDEKVCIRNGFHSSMLFNSEKSNTIFYQEGISRAMSSGRSERKERAAPVKGCRSSSRAEWRAGREMRSGISVP